MAINFGALLRYAPAAAQGLGAYRKGAMAGEREREQNERADAAQLFEQFARRRQLEQTDRTINQRGELQAERLANAEALKARDAQIRELVARINTGSAERRTGMTVGQRAEQAGMQYGEGGSVDRTNDSRLQGVRITVDGANRRDNTIVTMPDGTFAVVDATGRATPLGGTPYQPPKQGAGPGGLTTPQRLTERNRLKSQYMREPEVKSASELGGVISSISNSLKLAGENPQSQLSVVYQLVRLYDPRTGVRPSELELQANITSLPERVKRIYLNWNRGKILTPQMIADIEAEVAQRSQELRVVEPVQARYGQTLRDLGMESDSAYVAPTPWSGVGRGAQKPKETEDERIARLLRGGR